MQRRRAGGCRTKTYISELLALFLLL